MADQWQEIQARHDEIITKSTDTSLDGSERAALQKELSQLTTILSKQHEIKILEQSMQEIKAQAAELADPELLQLYQDELQEVQHKIDARKHDLENFMFPPDIHDNRSVFLEVRAGTGGQEAALFAADLAKMYTNYALRQGWKVAVDGVSGTDLGGFREVVLHIEGKDVYGHLKWESGVHRVQRVPATETQGRVHTSTATVAVLPEAEEVDVQINPSDLRIDTYRAGGAGGQHVNMTDSAVRITHLPTGAVVACQDERSQHKNKAKAMKMLQARILAAQVEKAHAEMSKIRKDQVGSGQRAEKVRTYNYPQNRITDHQVDVTLKKLDMVMLGALDEIVQALREKDRTDRQRVPFLERIKARS